jgi:serine/threonine protein phosphatase PrpC
MGCSNSKEATLVTGSPQVGKGSNGGDAPPRQPQYTRLSVDGAFNQLDRAQSFARVQASSELTVICLSEAKVTLTYAHITQTGYYPTIPDKPNQDSLFISSFPSNLGSQEEMLLFGVLDGHGEYGTDCAVFSRDMIKSLISKHPRLQSEPGKVIHDAIISTNMALHGSPIDDSLSGTTVCTAILQGRKLTVGNVGDSRMVLAVQDKDDKEKLVAFDVTHDQTPFRRDEQNRVITAGARVMTLEQLEGRKDPNVQCWTVEAECDGDPPRIWAVNGLYPGTAFTRSVGDSIAEQIGVIADPELTTVELDGSHKFAILATDGLWEFVSSQHAVDIVANLGDSYDAVVALNALAYQRWMDTEGRTDDISILVMFFDYDE